MNYKLEKSCGAVVYKVENNILYFLIEKMKRGHYSIPKGHIEKGETEIMTALREIKEETNLQVDIDTNFREVVRYSPYEGCMKDVVFFIAKATSFDIKNQPEEVSELLWLEKDEAISKLTYQSDIDVINKVYEYLKKDFIFIKKGSKVLCQGDSVTDCHRNKDDEKSLGESHAKMLQDKLNKYEIKVINKGVSGNKVNDLLARFDRDFKNVNPDIIFLLIGVNDTWHDFPNNKSAIVFKNEYENLILKIKNEMNCKLVLLEPFILGYDREYTIMRNDLFEKIDAIRELSKKYTLKYIAFENIFAEKFIFEDVYDYTIEGIHLLEKGYKVITDKILSKIIVE